MRQLTTLLVFSLVIVGAPAARAAQTIVAHDHYVESTSDPSIKLFVREKYASDAPSSTGKAVLFVHGSYAPGGHFDLPVPGYSFLSFLAANGYAAYTMDIRGYGYSSRPAAVGHGGDNPIGHKPHALADIGDIVAFIRRRTDVARIDLVGFSHGTYRVGYFAAAHPELVRKIVMLGGTWISPNRRAIERLKEAGDGVRLAARHREAYRVIPAGAPRMWDRLIQEDDKTRYRDARTVSAMADYLGGSDRDWRANGNLGYRAPNGATYDFFKIARGVFDYDPSMVLTPTLVINGSWDISTFGAWHLYRRLGAPYKRLISISRGTHFIHLEYVAPQVHREVLLWLSEEIPRQRP